MKKQLTLATVLVLFTGMALAGISNVETTQEFDTVFTGGDSTEAIVEFDNEASNNLPITVELEVESIDGYTLDDSTSGAFSVSGELDTDGHIRSFDNTECSFQETNEDAEGIYYCSEVFDSDAGSSNELTTTVTSALNIKAGNYDLNLNLYSGIGDIDVTETIAGEVNFGNFNLEFTEVVNGETSHYNNLVYEAPEGTQFEAAFDVRNDEDTEETIDVTYNYDESDFDSWDDYEISLYKWSSWTEIDHSVDRDNEELTATVTVGGNEDAVYGVYVEEIEEEVDDEEEDSGSSFSGGSSTPISDRETTQNVISQSDRGARVSINNVAENREINVELPETASEEAGSALTGVSFSNSRSTSFMDLEVESFDQEPEGTSSVRTQNPDFRSDSFTQLRYSGTAGGDINEASFDFRMNNDRFERADNVVMYRIEDDGDDWHALETELVEEREDRSLFRSQSPGMSVLAAGEYESDIEVTETSVDVEEVEAGESTTVQVTLENSARGAGTHTVEYTVDGETVHTEEVEVAGSSTETTSYTHEFQETGTYSIGTTGQESSLTVIETEEAATQESEPEFSWKTFGKIASGIILLTAVVVLGILWRREDLDKLEEYNPLN